MKKLFVVATLSILFIGCPVIAEDAKIEPAVPVVTATAEPASVPSTTVVEEKDASWIENNLAFIGTVIVGILSIFGGWTKIEGILQRKLGENKFKLVKLAEGAVASTYATYVSALKKGKEDGKLTKEEAETARKMAIDKIKEEAKTTGLDIAKTIGEAALPALIEKAVNSLKKDAKDAK